MQAMQKSTELIKRCKAVAFEDDPMSPSGSEHVLLFMGSQTKSCVGISLIDPGLFVFMHATWHLPDFLNSMVVFYFTHDGKTIFSRDESLVRGSLVLRLLFCMFLMSDLIWCFSRSFRFGEVGGSLCHVSKSRHQDCEQGETQRISVDEGKDAHPVNEVLGIIGSCLSDIITWIQKAISPTIYIKMMC